MILKIFYTKMNEQDEEIPVREDSPLVEITEETREQMIQFFQTQISKMLEEAEKMPELPKYTYIKDNEVLTIIYTEKEELVLPTIVVIDYYNKIDLRYIINSTPHDLFTEEYALDISRYIRHGNLPQYIQDYIDEVEGIEKQPMCKEGLAKLQPKQYDSAIHASEKCQICLEPFTAESKVTALNCKHVFCYDCIKMYFEQYNNTCPLCRVEVDKKEEKNPTEDELDLRQVAYRFIENYCECCNECQRHQQRNQIVELFISANGTMELDECIQLVKH